MEHNETSLKEPKEPGDENLKAKEDLTEMEIERGENLMEKGVFIEAEIGRAVTYSVDQAPPWYLCLVLGFQVINQHKCTT